ncbi:MAG: hypothetical protein D3922_15985 [Candidatus Electrothrix sp. AR1]|nr:hypothetical protein [Candidatus Electrothrix sp. AR1]
MRDQAVIFLGLCLFSLIGCQQSALLKMSNESQEIADRIPIKEQYLGELEGQQQILQQEKERLHKELSSQQLTLDELSEKLEALHSQNARIKAVDMEQQRKKDALSLRLQKYQNEIKGLRLATQSSAEAIPEKEKRLEELQEKIRLLLEMDLAE